jgi:hypothetical protein
MNPRPSAFQGAPTEGLHGPLQEQPSTLRITLVTSVAPEGTLAARHLAELHEDSGLTLETIEQRGYQTIHTAAELRARNFSEAQCRLVPGLLMPIHGPDGSNGRYQFKPDRPRNFPGKDKPNKYESQAGLPNCLDVPVRCQSTIADPSVDLFITEGLKKADALAGIGKTVVGITGVWNWQKDHTLLDDWQPILPSLTAGRRCFTVLDSDAASNANVRLAEEDLAIRFLEHRGADAYIVRLPPGPNGEKQGVDDFIARYGADVFNQLIAETVQARRAELQQLRQERSAIFAALRNPHVKNASVRVANVLAVNELASDQSRGKSMPRRTTIYAVRKRDGEAFGMAVSMGLNRNTVSAALKLGSAPGGPFTKTEKFLPKDGYKAVFLEPRFGTTLQMYQALGTLKPEPDRVEHRGGDRTCPDHPGAKLVRTETLLYFDCGCVVSVQPLPLHKLCATVEPEVEETQETQETPVTSFDPPPLRSLLAQTLCNGDEDHHVDDPADRRSDDHLAGRCPGCGEAWTPRKGSGATQCGMCAFYAQAVAS